MVCGLFSALSVIVTSPGRSSGCSGEKITARVQLEFAARDPPYVAQVELGKIV